MRHGKEGREDNVKEKRGGEWEGGKNGGGQRENNVEALRCRLYGTPYRRQKHRGHGERWREKKNDDKSGIAQISQNGAFTFSSLPQSRGNKGTSSEDSAADCRFLLDTHLPLCPPSSLSRPLLSTTTRS